MEPLVSTEWLAAELGSADISVFDCTMFLPNEGKDARAEFRRARIPGARFFDINEVADPETDLPHMVPGAGRFARLLGALGVSDNTRAVFYDQKGLFSAARGWWLMQLFGHGNAAVLDGGLPKWQRENRPVESGEPANAAPAQFTPDFRAERLRGIGDMKAILGADGALVLDARAKGRFDGTAPEPRPGLPSGHMPGARNIPFTDLLNADGTMLPPDALRQRFAREGADGSRPVVTTCGTGVSACVLALGLARAGLPDAAVYDGSWTEWAARPETAKVNS